MRKQKIDLAGCKLILKDGKTPKLKMSRKTKKEILDRMAVALVIADQGMKIASRKVRGAVKELPTLRRKVNKGGKQLRRSVKRRIN